MNTLPAASAGGTVIPDGANGAALILALAAIGFMVLVVLLVLIRGREKQCQAPAGKQAKNGPSQDV